MTARSELGKMPVDFTVKVSGLRELSAAFKKLSDHLAAEGLKVALMGIASRVAADARLKVPQRSGTAARSIQPRASTRGASIAFGGQAAPYMPWLDFGGSTGRRHQLGPNMGVVHRDWMGRPVGAGRYIYPAIEAARPATAVAVEAAVIQAAAEAEFEVR